MPFAEYKIPPDFALYSIQNISYKKRANVKKNAAKASDEIPHFRTTGFNTAVVGTIITDHSTTYDKKRTMLMTRTSHGPR
jgi:hypothetical protein